ncbi:hypothetical protein C8J57DRAFT_184290 [Mycena rebaudengoi]|nr:hypothetical protein C8J57DRAFT_184290 [Mycena rebaudengoi]
MFDVFIVWVTRCLAWLAKAPSFCDALSPLLPRNVRPTPPVAPASSPATRVVAGNMHLRLRRAAIFSPATCIPRSPYRGASIRTRADLSCSPFTPVDFLTAHGDTAAISLHAGVFARRTRSHSEGSGPCRTSTMPQAKRSAFGVHSPHTDLWSSTAGLRDFVGMPGSLQRFTLRAAAPPLLAPSDPAIGVMLWELRSVPTALVLAGPCASRRTRARSPGDRLLQPSFPALVPADFSAAHGDTEAAAYSFFAATAASHPCFL